MADNIALWESVYPFNMWVYLHTITNMQVLDN